jgi:hypothetical protein
MGRRGTQRLTALPVVGYQINSVQTQVVTELNHALRQPYQ